ncbi:MAG: MerR family transcriptional regulator [Lachnospiraceae bacterium]|nr:MerR family transcriptional regulator [Lachnospiraceae bacterium]
MTMKEAGERYQVPLKILKEYESWGLCGAVKKVMGAWQYDDQDIERLGMIMTLHDIGFSSSEVKAYMRLALEGESTQAMRLEMLNRKRGKTLDEIHLKERQIVHMDYLRYEMQKDKKDL